MPLARKPKRAPRKLVAKDVQRLIRKDKEIKFNGTTMGTYVGGVGTAVSSTGLTLGLFAIAQGLTDSNRIGDTIFLTKRIEARLKFMWNPAEVALWHATVRCMLVQCKNIQSTAAGPAFTEILDPGSSGAFDVYSPRRKDTLQLYNILYDELFPLQGNLAAGVPNSLNTHLINIDKQFPFLQKQIQYEAASATNAESGGLFMMMLSTIPAASAEPTVEGFVRLYFTDA